MRDANDRHVDAKSFLEDEKEVEEEVEEQSDDESDVETAFVEKIIKKEEEENSPIIEQKEKSKWSYFPPLLIVFLNFSNVYKYEKILKFEFISYFTSLIYILYTQLSICRIVKMKMKMKMTKVTIVTTRVTVTVRRRKKKRRR